MKTYYGVDNQYGIPESCCKIFRKGEEERAAKILAALQGLPVCTALSLLDRCKDAVMQSTVDAN